MTDVVRPLAVLALALPAALVVLLWCLPGAWTAVLARLGAVPTAGSAATAGARVVADTDIVRLGSACRSARAIEVLPAPEGEDSTSIRPRR